MISVSPSARVRRPLSAAIEPRGAAVVAAPVGAAALLAGAAIHLQQLVTIFHVVPTIGPLFVGDIAVSTVVAAVLLGTRARLAALAGVVVSASALAGLAVSSTVGLAGWNETLLRPSVVAAIAAEGAAIVALAPLCLPRPRRAALRPRMLAAAGLAAVAVLHLAAAGPEWEDARIVFWLFIALACVCLALSVRLTLGVDRWAWNAVVALAVLPVAGYILTRVTAVPGDRADVGEWMTPLGLAVGAVEVALAGLALRMRRV